MRLKQCIFALMAMLLCAFSANAQESVVAKIGNVEYTTFASAMDAADAATGNVTVEVYGAVEFIDGMELNGSYTAITFTGMSTGAKITINQTAGGDYLTAHGKTVAFNDLILAKANPAWSDNSGHMGNYFSIQGGTVTYTDCTFPNGACTSTGTAVYNNCTFQNASEYGLWVYDDALVTVNGGTIDSTKGIKVYSEGEDSVTSTLTVQNATFTENVTAKPAVAVGYAQSITLIGNTYNNTTAHVELDSGSDADCDGIAFVAEDSEGNDISSELTVVDRSNSSAACGVLVDGKIYTTVTTAAAEATSGSTVTLLYSTTETVELPEGVTLDTNGFTADNVTVEVSLAGEGTEASPYLISSVADLETLRNKVNAGNSYEGQFVKLAADLTLTEAWTPIGNGTRSSKSYSGNAFKGTFDGGNKTISGLKITSTTGDDAAIGLFGVVDGGTVKNLTLDNVDINVANSDLAGGAIGLMLGGATAENITVNGEIVGNDGVGGIVGRLVINGTIKDCTNNASVTSSYGGIGGIVGKAYYEDGANTTIFASIDNCTNNGTVTAPMYVGGIVGLARANVTDCVNNGPVVGGTQTGGIIGQLIAAGTVSGNENKAKISGKNHLGGIIGDYSQSREYTYYNVAITSNINRGELAATEQCAAIMGCNNIDGFTAMTATGNVSYYFVEGLELFGNPEDMVIDDTNKFISPVAKIGDVEYETLAEAVAVAQAGDEIVLLVDVAEDATLPAGVKFNGNGKAVGNLIAGGEITFTGVTKATSFGVEYTNTTVNIVPGASLEITGTGRMVIGHGCTFNITGSIEDAKTADVADLTPSLIMPGASFTGAGVTFNVTNAYIKATAYCSSKNSYANGTFNFNVTNSVWEQANTLVFSAPTNSMDPTFNLNLVNSVLNSTSHLVFAVTKGEIVIDNSNVNVGTARQIENRSTMTIKNGSVVNGAVATSENAKNPGTLIVENATYAVTGEFSGSDLGTGTLIVKKGATVSAGSITNANIQIDATGMAAGDVINLTANLSNLAGTIEVINNDNLDASIVDGKIVLAVKPVAKIGDVEYETLAEAVAAAESGATITLMNGEHELPLFSGKELTFVGESKEGVIVNDAPAAVTQGWNGSTFHFENLTAKGATENYHGLANGVVAVTYKNCNINGLRFLYATEGVSFEDCAFNAQGVEHSFWTYGASNVTVKNSTFTYTDRAVNCYSENGAEHEADITFEGCTFTYAGTSDSPEGAVEINSSTSKSIDLTMNNCTAPEKGAMWFNSQWDSTKGENTVVSVDDVKVWPLVAKVGETKYADLQEAIKAAAPAGTVELLSNVVVDEWIMFSETLSISNGDIITTQINGLTINGNGKTVTIKDIESAGNGARLFYDATNLNINNLTFNFVDNAADLGGIGLTAGTIKNVTFNGGGCAIFPGTGAVTIEGCTFKTNATSIYYEQERDNLVVKGNTFENPANVNVILLRGNTTFTNNIVKSGRTVNVVSGSPVVTGNNFNDVRFKVYNVATATIENNTINTLAFNDESVVNSTFDSNILSTEAQAVLDAAKFTVGSNSLAYTKEENGYVRVWGEGGGNAKESYELKLYSGETLIATTKLNNVGNIIDGDVYVTWNFYYPQSTDEYWTTTWEAGHPNSAAQPTEVELYIDGTLVATTAAKMSGADDVAPVVWRNLGGVAIADLLGEGTETSPYLISNKKELLWFQAKVDEQAADGSTQFAGKYFKLTADIDLNNENWNPIGSMSGDHGSFKGVFDGGDHTISNLKVEQAGNGIGLFARTTGNAVIKNLKLNNVSVKSTDNSNYVGAVVGNAYASTKIENVHVSGNVLVSGRGYIGGIAGHGYVVMDNVSVVATGDGQGNDKGLITSTFWCAGGILGYAGEGATNIMNANVENVVVTSAAGGLGAIVGMAEDNNGTQPISGSNLSAKDVEIKTYTGAYGDSYANYALGYLYGGNPTSKLTGELSVENVTLTTSNGVAPTPVDAAAKVNDAIYFSLQKALDAAAAGTGNVTVEILSDVDLTGIDWNPVTVSAPGYPVVTVEGNNKTITGLNDMLFHSTWAGNSGLIIKNLTIANSTIVNDKDDANGNVGVGAFIGFPQASETITLENCHLKNSSVEGGHWTGGLIGMAGGYNGNDGPVFMNLTIKGCSVTGSTITGKGSVGGVIGHGSCAAWTNVVIEETTVSGNTITSTGSSNVKAGAVMGTIGAAGQPTTANGETKTGGATVSATVAGNTVTSNGTAITTIYGRQGTETGMLYVAGGSYDNYPIEQGVAYAAPIEGYEIVQNTDGTYGIQKIPAYVAKIGEQGYETLAAALAAAQDDDVVTLLADVETADGIVITDKNLVIDLNGKTYTTTEGASTNNRNFKIEGTSVVTIKNGTMVAAGDYSSGAYGTVRTEGSANVTLEGLKLYNYRGNGLNIKACGSSLVTINDTEIYSNYGGGIESAGGTIEIANVKVEQKGMYTAPYNSMAISVNGGGKVTVNSGTFSTECITAEEANNQGTSHGPWVAGVLNSGGTLIINGGTFSNDNFGENSLATYARGAILADTKAKVEINGGKFNVLKNVIDIQNNLGDANNNPSVVLAGGTYNADPRISASYSSNLITLADGYVALPDLNGNYVVGVKPTATVNNLGMTTVAAGDYMVYGNGDNTADMPLSFVMQFLADQTEEDMETSPYAEWYGDFVITFTGLENGSFTADGCYLAGHYGSFGWVKVPVDGMTIEEGARYPVMLGVGMGQKYDYICSSVQDFKCALYLTPEILEANPNIQVKLELAVVDNSKGSDDAASALINNENVYSVTEYTYDAEDFVVDPNYIAEFTIDDAARVDYVNDTDKTVGTLTYKRTFAEGAWNPLYLPFQVDVAQLADNYDIAYYNQMLSSDSNNDGAFDSYIMEVAYITSGTLKANYPYFIRPKTSDDCYLEYVANDVTLCAAKETVIVTSSVANTFKLHGTHKTVSAADLAGCYTIKASGWVQTTIDLRPHRLYLEILENDNSPFVPAAAKSIRIVVRGEDGYTGVEEITGENGEEMIFDLQGRRVLEPEKGGMYIINGKKVIY